MYLITKYGRKGGLGIAWALIMTLLFIGFCINWVLERAIPALTRTLQTIEGEFNRGYKPVQTARKEEGIN